MIGLTDLNRMDQADFVAAIGYVAEHSPWVVRDAWTRRPFADREGLAAALAAAMHAGSAERQLGLIRAHPDLAGRAAITGDLTADSAREQAGTGLDRLSPAEYERFRRLNDAYRSRFGFPFIICVREYTKEGILASFEERIGHTPADEVVAALDQIGRIVSLRVHDAVAE